MTSSGAGQNKCLSLLPVILLLLMSSPAGAAASPSLWESPYVPANPHVTDTIRDEIQDSLLFRLNLIYLNAVNDHKSPYEIIPVIESMLELDSSLYNLWFDLGMEQLKIQNYEKAIDAINRGLVIFPASNRHNLFAIYISLSYCYHKTNRHQKEKEILETAARIHPDHPDILGRYAICAHSRLRHTEAEYYIRKLVNALRKDGLSESDIAYHIGTLFMTTDYVEAEKYLRTASHYDPEDQEKKGALAWVLIRNALKIKEGMKLIAEALEADPGNAAFIHYQGYGYYLQGNYQKALENLRKASDLSLDYNFDLENHLKLVEKALTSEQE